MLAVRIDDDHDVDVCLPGVVETRANGRAVAAVLLVLHYLRSGERGHLGRIVRRAVVDDHDLVRVLQRTQDDAADGHFFVVGRDRDQDLQRLLAPAMEQAVFHPGLPAVRMSLDLFTDYANGVFKF